MKFDEIVILIKESNNLFVDCYMECNKTDFEIVNNEKHKIFYFDSCEIYFVNRQLVHIEKY